MNAKYTDDKLYHDDFKVSISDDNGVWININEVNEMIKNGVVSINREATNKYVDSWRIVKL